MNDTQNPVTESAAAQGSDPLRELENAVKPKPPLKTLATCKPSEFLRQTYRIKKLAEDWLTETDILNIRKNRPKIPPINPTMTLEEQEEQRKRNEETLHDAAMKNLSAMFDAIAGEHPDETLALMALCCFVEPENVDDHEIGDYIEALSGMLAHRATLSFFTSLVQWTRLLTPEALKA